jgi:RND family efflux transporter MFP subunit
VHHRRIVERAAVALLFLTAACADEEPGAGSAAAAPARPASGAAGRGGPTVVLASTDVASVVRGPIEAATPVTGDLRPIETVMVRARIEGDLTGVYVREGDRVSEGQLLARFEASEQEGDRRSAEAERVAAESELTTARWNLEQSEELFRAGAIAERDHRTAQQAVNAASARLAAAEARLRSTSSFVRDTRVLAPTGGVIERRLVENGEHIARGAEMFTLVRNDVLELGASVPARLANDVRVGQLVRFSAEGRAFDGRVARVSPTVDPSTRSVMVYVQVPNVGGSLKGNTFASGRIIGRTIPDALLVPTTALRQSAEDGRPFVYRIAADTLTQAPVELGVIDESAGRAEVVAGLSPGDRIVVGNVGTLGRGMRVQIVGGENRRAGE